MVLSKRALSLPFILLGQEASRVHKAGKAKNNMVENCGIKQLIKGDGRRCDGCGNIMPIMTLDLNKHLD